MKFLLVAKQERHATAYVDLLQVLAERGHDAVIAVQEADVATRRLAAEAPAAGRVRITSCPSSRIDEWAPTASLIRRLRDALHYQQPAFGNFPALQNRFLHKLRHDLALADAEMFKAGLQIPQSQLRRLEEVLRLAERSVPTFLGLDEFIRAERPDVLLVSPLIHLGPSQADVVASGQRLGIPVWMLLFSWDNLSTKGCMHVEPDLMFVWNEQQRAEAGQLHAYPSSQVVVVGAHRFDTFFELRPAMNRDEFHVPLGFDPGKPTLLYLCSSPLVAPHELPFLERWLTAVRNARSETLRGANVIIRPHPAIALLPRGLALAPHRWPAAPQLLAHVARPFADNRVIVLQTPHEIPNGLYESIFQSAAVVALNTTAELEAGIVGRPVFALRPDPREGADHQATLHFHYLTRENGGFVSVAPDLDQHVAELAKTLETGFDETEIRMFIQSFVRPHGIARPVLPLFADALEAAAARSTTTRSPTVAVPATPETMTMRNAVVALSYGSGRIQVRATPEATERVNDQGTVRIDRATVKWLDSQVKEGDVLYDIYAGFGAYALIAARGRGAAVVAFEPDHRLYASLGDNVALNACEETVTTIPLALKNCDTPLKVSQRANAELRGLRPFALHRLDTVVERYQLRAPTHIRLSSRLPTLDIIKGARRTLSTASLRSVWLSVPLWHGTAVSDELSAIGFHLALRRDKRKSLQLLMTKTDGR